MNIKKIAKIANVSIATISRVINDKPGVKAEVRERIKKILKENDYTPNLMARGLVRKKSNTIGLMIPRFLGYYTERTEAILEICKKNKYNVMIASAVGRFQGEAENFNMLLENQVEGIIYFVGYMSEENREIIKKINKKIPVILVDQSISEFEIPTILPDNYDGAIKIMEYIIGKGHSKIAFIGGPKYDHEGQKRYTAYKYMMKKNKFEIKKGYFQEGVYSIESGYEATKKIFEESEELPTIIFSSNDNMAIGAIKEIQKRGYKVPEDISVIGIDDIEIAKHFTPPLTTLKQNQYEIGRVAGQLVLDCINNKEIKNKKVIIGQDLIIRESVKKINK